jgi:hypothetical protein
MSTSPARPALPKSMSYGAGSKMGTQRERNQRLVRGLRASAQSGNRCGGRRPGQHRARGRTTAGPVVRDIVKAYYDKKSGVKIQEYTAKNG